MGCDFFISFLFQKKKKTNLLGSVCVFMCSDYLLRFLYSFSLYIDYFVFHEFDLFLIQTTMCTAIFCLTIVVNV